MDLDEIMAAPRNAKNHAAEEIGRSIGHFGLADLPTLDDRTGRLVAGHGRINDIRTRRDAGGAPPDGVKVGKGGRWLAPVVRGWSSRSDEDAEAYLIASNQLTTLGGWDNDALAESLAALAETDLLDLTGFDQAALDALLAPDDDPPDPIESADALAGSGDDGYKEQYGVIVMCRGEDEQQKVYERLIEDGYKCRVVTT